MFCQLSRRNISAMIKAPPQPRAAASVGVMKPPNIPPNTMTARIYRGHRSKKLKNMAFSEKAASLGAMRGFTTVLMAAKTMNIPASMTPGRTPPAKSLPTEVSVSAL